jgi:hypothetical protein
MHRATVSSTVELVLGRLPNETSHVDITNKLIPKAGGSMFTA